MARAGKGWHRMSPPRVNGMSTRHWGFLTLAANAMLRSTQMKSDLTFFTNEPNETLLDRFKATLQDVQFFDVLVGYFRTSGFDLLQASFASIEKIRILVGLNVGPQAFEIIEQARQPGLDFDSHQQTQDTFSDALVEELENARDAYDTEVGVQTFIEMIQSGKLEIMAHPSQGIHAKVYIGRFFPEDRDFGRVITGSSNFSYSGLQGNYEFNVELKNAADVRYALEKFEALWAEAVPISQTYVETVRQRTWLNDQITPYELYLKFLYEYFKEDINADQEVDVHLPPGFLELAYQKQAVVSARKILESYNGVFLADVVGLGKTFISAMLAQQLPGKKLVICPPVLKAYWEQTFFQFNVSVVVESRGKLEHILARNPDRFDYVFVDEAHRFRNELTQGYEMLHRICWGKKVILVSATPINNTIEDIYSQLKLFQAPKKSLIPGVTNLDAFFAERRKRLNRLEKGSPDYLAARREVAQEVRNHILKYVMVRRTRKEIANFFSQDMRKRGLFFPELADPRRIIYRFDRHTDAVFTQTIDLLKQFRYARYTPLLYLKAGISDFEAQSQRNVGGFMKGLLVKRLESSFFAFKKSLGRFIQSYERFIAMVEQGNIYIGQDVDIYDLLESDDEAKLLELIEAGEVQQYPVAAFKPTLFGDLQRDLTLLREVQALWADVEQDPKLDQFVSELRHNPLLKGRRVIVFTESAETGDYLARQLDARGLHKVLFYASNRRWHPGGSLSKAHAQNLIEANFNPEYHEQEDTVRILISTDVLAEGVNLHRSNLVINYDLPWNPTRVLQRVGRVNRVGTEHERIYIFNFFPTAQSDEHLGLEGNITAKIQAFHDMLGEDAKYLTEEEDVAQFELFGDRLYRRLNRKETFEGEEAAGRSELEFLRQIQDVRDNDPALFDKIKRLPRKARTARALDLDLHVGPAALLTFFRQGRLKKFFITGGEAPIELTFLDAVDLLHCAPDTPRRAIPKRYYDWLAQNKQRFEFVTSPATQEKKSIGGGRTNEDFILRLLKAKAVHYYRGFTDEDEAYIRAVRRAFEAGNIPRNTAKRLKDAINARMTDGFDPLKLLHLLKHHIPDALLYPRTLPQLRAAKREVILSEYLIQEP
jgi:superfamily II DNA/RNA helicase/HKD family nuclease